MRTFLKNAVLLLLILSLVILPGCRKESFTPSVDGWTLTERSDEQLCDGVTFTELLFMDESALPHRAYVLTVSPENVTLRKGTSQNGYEVMPQKRQTVMEHMQASVADGHNVIAAVNGDFFAISSTYMPSGLSIKDGTVLRENNTFRPFSAYTVDGEYKIFSGTEKVDLHTLSMATGGSHVLLRNGQPDDVNQAGELSTASHPRTLSGVRADKTMLFIVIDGRQKKHSNGATLLQCAQLMQSMGAVDAINHDGGGSSSMVLRIGDAYTTVNSPSDGQLRKVFCSIQITLK
ncbi:MAG: phosphodiester glycosidase family protein [Oscillospiraceae bacterium]|nr:phosphodiester glycosidase family protein [Oscillospiraceae bacterium]